MGESRSVSKEGFEAHPAPGPARDSGKGRQKRRGMEGEGCAGGHRGECGEGMQYFTCFGHITMSLAASPETWSTS